MVVAFSESGMISALDVQDRYKGAYHLQFITMEPSSLFLPVLLHADMVFYVHTGKGTVTWVGDDGTDDSLDVEKGDIYKLKQGTVFYIHSHPDSTKERLRIHAIFDTQEAFVGAYSNLSDLVRGFDVKVLQMGFRVSEEAIQTIKGVEKPPSMIPFAAKNESDEVRDQRDDGAHDQGSQVNRLEECMHGVLLQLIPVMRWLSLALKKHRLIWEKKEIDKEVVKKAMEVALAKMLVPFYLMARRLGRDEEAPRGDCSGRHKEASRGSGHRVLRQRPEGASRGDARGRRPAALNDDKGVSATRKRT
ncbi:hypothetical protein J5N97_022981 [Dioscorea zingiberensis]|uniref:Cupin type-1 domain-containing protein n=1 Tax=Dioscorea zingiberensis TaxID=325984 RepID=A0A9D5CBX2_9LILI|nr:hypothetical protein J5N97_022981 [Dioscorea zingiberensis]